MQEASFLGVLKVILILLLIYYGLKILTRLFGPLLLRYVTKKAGERFQQQFQQQFQQYNQSQSSGDNDVTIDKKPKQKSTNKDVGEYIDFEEID
ncbi:hypothetical protein GCM10009430_19360 [Aquimarina litoralis]|uniref:DUF4834 family protein n=1 Tax=Aquimarina litoralis TaxID=584605 RepID=A0ABP3TXA0_9FLAO